MGEVWPVELKFKILHEKLVSIPLNESCLPHRNRVYKVKLYHMKRLTSVICLPPHVY